MPKRGIPDRWLDYCKYGKQIEGTRFIALKVPLKESLCSSLPNSKEWFTPAMALHELPGIGMVIDLTNTSRYYDPEIFRERNVKYLKILCEGHGKLPGSPIINKFFQGVDEFIKDGQRNGQLIAVHCTHGLNRTGFFICRYMIDRMGFAPADAIAAFNDARGHKMERPEYIEALARVDQRYSPSHAQQSRRQDPRASEYHNGIRSTSRDQTSRSYPSSRDPYREVADPHMQHRAYEERPRQQVVHSGRQIARTPAGYQSFESDYRAWNPDYTADHLAHDFATDVRMDSYRQLENKCVADVRRSFSEDRRNQSEDRRIYADDRRSYPDARRNHSGDRRTYSEDRSSYRRSVPDDRRNISADGRSFSERNYSDDRRSNVSDYASEDQEVCRDPSMRDFHKDQFPYAYRTPAAPTQSQLTQAYREQELLLGSQRREELVYGYPSSKKEPTYKEPSRDPDSGYGSGRSDYAQRRRDYDTDAADFYRSTGDAPLRRDVYGDLSTPERARSSPTPRVMPYDRYEYPEGSTGSYGDRSRTQEHVRTRSGPDGVTANRGAHRRPSAKYRDVQ